MQQKILQAFHFVGHLHFVVLCQPFGFSFRHSCCYQLKFLNQGFHYGIPVVCHYISYYAFAVIGPREQHNIAGFVKLIQLFTIKSLLFPP